MEHKAITTEIKAAGDGGFEGYASVFGVRDSYDDVVTPGAYAKTLQERKGKVRSLWNHDAFALPIGRFKTLQEDGHGLFVAAEFAKTAFAQDVRVLVSEGAIDSMSIGYRTIKATFGEDNGTEVRYLNELALMEVSLVNFPANEAAIVTGSKSIDHLARTISQLEDLISVGIKSGRPLSAENLTRLQTAYTNFHALLQAKGEPLTHSPTPEAATQDAEPPTHSDDLLTELKSFTVTPQSPDDTAVLAEVKRAFAFIHTGA